MSYRKEDSSVEVYVLHIEDLGYIFVTTMLQEAALEVTLSTTSTTADCNPKTKQNGKELQSWQGSRMGMTLALHAT